jgi:L-proline amide hydrolase
MPQWIAETNRLRSDLPPEVQETLQAHEKAGTTDDPAYQEAMFVFYRRHVCRLDPFPECMNRAFEKMMQSPQVYMTMVGPSEFFVTGTLKDWDIVNRLGEIRVPALVLGGRYDEATPTITKTVHQGIPGSEWVIFEESSHSPHMEEPERYLHVLTNFLDRVELKIALDKDDEEKSLNW